MSRELDEQIAVEVMGWRRHNYRTTTYGGGYDTWRWIDADSPPEPWQPEDYPLGRGGPDWSPSTDPAAMMQVVEKMQSLGWWCSTRSPFNPSMKDDESCCKWMAGFTTLGCTGFNGRPDYSAFADTLPEAVCLAALEAVSHKVQ